MKETGPSLSPARVLITLLLIDMGVGAMHLIFSTDPAIGSFFNLAHEENLPTWYSSFQFLLVSGAGWFCYAVEKSSNNHKSASWGWLVVALCMLGLAIDETFQIHEAVINQIMSGKPGDNLRQYFGATKETDSLLWTVVFAPAIILAGTGLLIFYYSRSCNNISLFQLSFIPLGLLVLSAGLEFVEAKILNSLSEKFMARYRMLAFIEEMAELFAASLFVWIHYRYGVETKLKIQNADE